MGRHELAPETRTIGNSNHTSFSANAWRTPPGVGESGDDAQTASGIIVLLECTKGVHVHAVTTPSSFESWD